MDEKRDKLSPPPNASLGGDRCCFATAGEYENEGGHCCCSENVLSLPIDENELDELSLVSLSSAGRHSMISRNGEFSQFA